MDYFYISTKARNSWVNHKLMSVGDIVSTQFPNPFFNYFRQPSIPPVPVNFNGQQTNYSRVKWLQGLGNGTITTDVSKEMIAQIGSEMAMHFCKYTRELIWEAIRLESYNDKPSRQKCLWVSEGEESLEFWKTRLSFGSNSVVYRVELDGITHEASDEWLMRDDTPYDTAIDNAHKYWQGAISDPIAREILFEGKMRIVEQVS